jgi:hypothetical protein
MNRLESLSHFMNRLESLFHNKFGSTDTEIRMKPALLDKSGQR